MTTKNALISVYDKTNLEDFVDELEELGWTIYASGGTADYLKEYAFDVIDIRTLAGRPILGHRVVTLSREIHAGLLARKDVAEDMETLADLGLPYFDLVCVDTYPLKKKALDRGVSEADVIEATDIGGPAMIRAAAKGRRIVICDKDDRYAVIAWLKEGMPKEDEVRRTLAASAEAYSADYALASAMRHGEGSFFGQIGSQTRQLKYGENAWQKPAAQYELETDDPLALHRFTLLQGDPGFVNLTDIDRLLQTVTHAAAGFEKNGLAVPSIAVGAKHGNPCGAAASLNIQACLQAMLEGDARAIFGGVVMTTIDIHVSEAEILLRHGMEKGRRHLAALVAPSVSPDALTILKKKKEGPEIVVFVNGALGALGEFSLDTAPRMRPVRGGFLLQPNYAQPLDFASLTRHQPPGVAPPASAVGEGLNAILAWAVGCTSNSNTVTLVKGGKLIGNGVGQQDRVGAAELAVKRARDAGHDVKGATAYSDSFFPFPDAPRVLAEAGVKRILTTSGSMRDDETIAVCMEMGVDLYMLPDKEGRGFYGH